MQFVGSCTFDLHADLRPLSTPSPFSLHHSHLQLDATPPTPPPPPPPSAPPPLLPPPMTPDPPAYLLTHRATHSTSGLFETPEMVRGASCSTKRIVPRVGWRCCSSTRSLRSSSVLKSCLCTLAGDDGDREAGASDGGVICVLLLCICCCASARCVCFPHGTVGIASQPRLPTSIGFVADGLDAVSYADEDGIARSPRVWHGVQRSLSGKSARRRPAEWEESSNHARVRHGVQRNRSAKSTTSSTCESAGQQSQQEYRA